MYLPREEGSDVCVCAVCRVCVNGEWRGGAAAPRKKKERGVCADVCVCACLDLLMHAPMHELQPAARRFDAIELLIQHGAACPVLNQEGVLRQAQQRQLQRVHRAQYVWLVLVRLIADWMHQQ